jgi:hypothetical protein
MLQSWVQVRQPDQFDNRGLPTIQRFGLRSNALYLSYDVMPPIESIFLLVGEGPAL